MLGAARGSGLTHTQRWWRERRPLEIEEQASALIRRHEVKQGPIPGIVVPPALLVREIGCELVYYSDDERTSYGIPRDAIGALDTQKLLVLIHHAIEVPGREGHTIGEEVGHGVLHANLRSPEQQALDMEVKDTTGVRLFCRTEREAFTDEQHEPVWMSMEAGYFAACLQMPRARYGTAAEEILRMLIGVRVRSNRRRLRTPTTEGRVARAMPYVQSIRDLNWSATNFDLIQPGIFDTNVMDNAIHLLGTRCEWQVSKAAQKRRLVELGLADDAADLLRGPQGERVLPRFEFLWVAERVVEATLRGEG